MFTIVIASLSFSFAVMLVMLLDASRRLASSSAISRSASEILEPAISTTAYGLIRATRQLIKYLFLRFLMFLHTLATFGRTILTQIERRFSLLIDAVRGRGQTPDHRHRGSVSFFLEQIKDYKEEMARRANLR